MGASRPYPLYTDGVNLYTSFDGGVTLLAVGGGGGGGTIHTSAPLSGDGSVGTPATIAAGAVPLTTLATQADQTILGNTSGGAASPIALSAAQAQAIAAPHTGAGLTGTGSVAAPLKTSPTEYYATLASPAASLLLSGLDGDTDGMYLVTIEMRSNAASNNLKIQVNGADTNLDCFSANTAVGGVAVGASWTLGQAAQNPATFSSGDLWRATLIMCARSGRIRTLESCSIYVVKGGSVVAWSFAGRYNDTATNITSMGIAASQASGLNTGSFIHCVRIQTTNPLA